MNRRHRLGAGSMRGVIRPRLNDGRWRRCGERRGAHEISCERRDQGEDEERVSLGQSTEGSRRDAVQPRPGLVAGAPLEDDQEGRWMWVLVRGLPETKNALVRARFSFYVSRESRLRQYELNRGLDREIVAAENRDGCE